MGEGKKSGFFSVPDWMRPKDKPITEPMSVAKKPDQAKIIPPPLRKETEDDIEIEVAPEAEVGTHSVIDWKEMSEGLKETRDKIRSLRDRISTQIIKIGNLSGEKNLETFFADIKGIAGQASIMAMGLNEIFDEIDEETGEKKFKNAEKFIEITIEGNFTLKEILNSLNELCRQITIRLQSLFSHLDEASNSLEITLGLAALNIGTNDLKERKEIFTKNDFEPLEAGLENLAKQLESLATKLKNK